MRITPLDIRKQEFRKVMRGVDSEEVYAFLTTVAEEYEAALSDNKALRERVLELDDKVQEYRTLERTLRDTLVTAERASADAKQNAQREADLIIKEAQIEAEKTLRDIKNQMMKLRQEVQTLQRERESYLTRMKMLAESFLKFIDSEERHFDQGRTDDSQMMADPESNKLPHAMPAVTEEPIQADIPAVDPPPEALDETTTPNTSSGFAAASLLATAGEALTPDEPANDEIFDPTEEALAVADPAPDIEKESLQQLTPEIPETNTIPTENVDFTPSGQTTVPDLNAILDRMVKEQKDILNDTPAKPDLETTGGNREIYQPTAEGPAVEADPPARNETVMQSGLPAQSEPTTQTGPTVQSEPPAQSELPAQSEAPAVTVEQEPPVAVPEQKQPAATEETLKEWSLEQLRKDIISE
jgi:cell division initiation protein